MQPTRTLGLQASASNLLAVEGPQHSAVLGNRDAGIWHSSTIYNNISHYRIHIPDNEQILFSSDIVSPSVMSDSSVYNLARKVRKNLSATALCQEPDLRRVVGHANMLDALIFELVDLGYDWNDNMPSEQTSFTPSGHVQWAHQVLGHTATERLQYADDFEPSGDFLYNWEDSRDLNQSENSNDSENSEDSEDPENPDDWDDSDNWSESDCFNDSDFASVEMFEGYGNRDTYYSKYILITKAQTSKDPSPDMSVLVAVRQISEFGGGSC
jgi:hypothetical protein